MLCETGRSQSLKETTKGKSFLTMETFGEQASTKSSNVAPPIKEKAEIQRLLMRCYGKDKENTIRQIRQMKKKSCGRLFLIKGQQKDMKIKCNL